MQDRTELSVVGSDWAAARLEPATLALLEREAAGAFAPERLLAGLAPALEGAPGYQRAAVVRFAETALGRRALAEGSGALTGERLRAQAGFHAQVMLEGMETPRWRAIRRLDAATGRTRDALAVGSARGLALAWGAHALSCLAPGDWPAARERVARRIAALRPHLEARVVAELGFRLDGVSPPELSRLARFAEEEGAWLYRSVGAGLREALAAAARDLVARLGPELEARCAGGAPPPA